MASPVIVPRCNEEWRPEAQYRVEHLNYAGGHRGFVYFPLEEDATAFASERTLRGQPCVVECRDMPITHTVSKFALTDPGYLFWTKNFGNLESAIAEFERGRELARERGGGYRICEASGKKLNEFYNYED